jgi:amidase
MAPRRPKSKTWRAIAEEAQNYRDSTISIIRAPLPSMPSKISDCVLQTPTQLLTKDETIITNLLPEEILDFLASGQLSATDVTNAYLKRACIAQDLVLLSMKDTLFCEIN